MFDGSCITVGLSGGADSVFLLTVLKELQPRFGYALHAVHVNHNLRGEESVRDESFCRSLCSRLNIPLKTVSCDVQAYANENKLSTEEAARNVRYAVFSELQGKTATAHNADDNLETAVLNLTRGTAVKGLAGIPPVRGNIIRPILTVTRAEIEEYLSENGIDFITDSSNLTLDYTRNKIRHKIIPEMQKLNASLQKTSVATLETLRLENGFIESQTDIAMEQCRNGSKLCGLSKFHKVIRGRCITRMLCEYNIPYSHKRIETVDSFVYKKGKLNLSGNFYVRSLKNGDAYDLEFLEITVHFKRGEMRESKSK